MQQIIVILIFLSALCYLLFRIFPGIFGLKKTDTGCNRCAGNVNVKTDTEKKTKEPAVRDY